MRFIIALSIFAGAFFYGAEWYIKTESFCPAPILYRLGETDERFNISDERLREIFLEAEAAWETALGRELFAYNETTDFTINFVYDDRQQLASTEEEWRMMLDEKQREHEVLVTELTELGARYESEQASYNTRREEYEQALAAYNAEVEKYNSSGGAPSGVYANLEAEADRLRTIARELSFFERQINTLAETINARGEEGNQKIAAYNAEVLEYNQVFGTLETFTQGDYKRDRINIYKFIDETELTRVIMHEFGHALGVPHVLGETSVMYYIMTDQAPATLSAEDVTALISVCGKEETWQQNVRQSIRSILAVFN